MTEYTVFHSKGGNDYEVIGKSINASTPQAAKNKAKRRSNYRRNFWVVPTNFISAFSS